MAVTVSLIKTRYPEYENAGDSLIQAHLDAAESVLNETTCGELYDEILLESACHRLALTSYARQSAIDGSAGQITKHLALLRELKSAAAPGSTGIIWGT